MGFKKILLILPTLLLAFVLAGSVANANHSWGSYHWSREANPFTLKIGNNVSSVWSAYLAQTSLDWSLSSVLDTEIIAGRAKGNCRPTKGRVEVCSNAYGDNGWLGIAQIWIDNSGHINQGVVKVNDTYFNTPTYNTSAWKNLVMCQEVGHTFGLDHQDELFTNLNLGTCMDYTNDPDGSVYNQLSNEHPNTHDYEQLELIYGHLDVSAPKGNGGKGKNNRPEVNLDNPSDWGKSLRQDSRGRNSLFERDLGNGNKVFTFVTWAK